MHRIRAIAAGGVIVLALAACQSGVQGQSGAPSLPPVPSNLASLAPSGLESLVPSASFKQLFPVFQAQGGADVTGGGIITEVEGGSSVVLGVVAPGAAEMLPAAIVEGDCSSMTGPGPTPPPDLFPAPEESGAAASGEPSGAASPAASEEPSAAPSASMATSFPLWLTPIAAGSSNSVVGVSVDDLVASPHAVIIEASPTDPTVIACADLKEGPPTLSSPGAGGGAGASGSPEASMDTGAGSSAGASPATSP